MNLLAGFADISVSQLLPCVALFATVVGGLAGYGTGALMPLVLVPLIGAEPVVPTRCHRDRRRVGNDCFGDTKFALKNCGT